MQAHTYHSFYVFFSEYFWMHSTPSTDIMLLISQPWLEDEKVCGILSLTPSHENFLLPPLLHFSLGVTFTLIRIALVICGSETRV